MNDDDTALTPSAPRGGRPKGALNRVTKDAAYLARAIVTDPDYLATLFERAMNGTLGPMEPVLWAYGFGRPKENVVLPDEGNRDLATMTTDELLARLDHLRRQLVEHSATDDAIDVTPAPTPAPPEPSLTPTYRQPETAAKHTAIDAVSEAANEKQTGSSESPSPETVANVVANDTVPPVVAPPLNQCPYCRRSLADCADMRATNPARFEMVHYDSPEMQAKRDERRAARDAEATAEMYESLRRARY